MESIQCSGQCRSVERFLSRLNKVPLVPAYVTKYYELPKSLLSWLSQKFDPSFPQFSKFSVEVLDI